MKKRLEYLIKNNRLIQKLYTLIGSFIFKFLGLFIKTNDKRILFSGHGGRMNDSSYNIYIKMIEDEKFQDYEFVWALNKEEMKKHTGIKMVEENTFKYFVECIKSKYWIATVNMEKGMRFKKRKQIYLNAGHGIPMNTIGNAAAKRNDYNFKNINYFSVSSEYEVPIYVRDYKVKEKSIVRSGIPRNETLFSRLNEQKKAEIKNKLKIPFDKKIIFYAPTWRKSKNKGKDYDIDIPIIFSKWKKEFSDKYVMIVRLHPFITKLTNVVYDDFVFNGSNYEEVNDLIQISDVLITDYSSIFFDYAITEKPILLYTYDLEDYLIERGLYLNPTEHFKTITFKKENDIVDAIKNESYDIDLIKEIKEKYHKYNQDSTNKLIKKIFKGDNL